MRKRFLPIAVIAVVLGLGMLLTYSVTPEDALNDTARRFGIPVQERIQADGDIEDPDSLYADATQNVSDNGRGRMIPRKQGINEIDHRLPVDAPLRGDPKARDQVTYDNVINQFEVEENPRYELRENSMMYESGVTYCNTFVWDVTRAMSAEIPYWLDEDGRLTEPWFTDEGRWRVPDASRWLTANDVNRWLNQSGPRSDWREVTAEEAQDLANQGYPTVVSVYDPYGVGHIGIVRPGEMLNGPALAQAGTKNVNYAHVYDFFPREGTQFFFHH